LLPTSASQSNVIGILTNPVFIVIGILIILALLYPYIKKKLKSDKNGEEASEETDEEIEEPSEVDSSVSSGKYERKNVKELEDLKKQFISRIKDLEKKYESGDLLDEEYEDKRKSYQDNLKEIEKKLKKMG
jgi:flagellar biosynthesis/type III secretory pathway M-ring protein FliF/YscJ